MLVRVLAVAITLLGASALPGAVEAQPGPETGFQNGLRNCQRALPAARRFIGRHERMMRARFRAPRGVTVRACQMCTFDYRPDRLTFGLDERQIVRSASCG